MQKKEIFIAQDWKEFDNEADCQRYESEFLPVVFEHTTYIWKDNLGVYFELKDKWYYIDDLDLNTRQKIANILNEVEIKIKIDIETGAYKILECDWRKLMD